MVSSTPPVFSPAIPLYARRVVRVYVVIPLVALGTITAAWFLGVGGLGRSPAVLVVAGIGVFAVSHGALLWYAIRLRRRLMRARGHICTQCGYELAGLAEQGRCPECGPEHPPGMGHRGLQAGPYRGFVSVSAHGAPRGFFLRTR